MRDCGRAFTRHWLRLVVSICCVGLLQFCSARGASAGAPGGHIIFASAGQGGSISPSGQIAVPDGAEQAFVMTPDPCFAVADVVVDGVSQGALTFYVFSNVRANHFIQATFALGGGQTQTVLSSNLNPSEIGESVTLTATVSPSNASGSVTFFEGGGILGSAPLNNGAAELAISTLSLGTHDITAHYDGDQCHSSSASQVLSQVVDPPSSLRLRPVFAQNLVNANHTVTATALDGGNPVPNRQVNFHVIGGPNNGLTHSDNTDVNGEATFTFSSASAGIDSVVADDGPVGHQSNLSQKQWFLPSQNETCNGLDDNGDGRIDEGFLDRDLDGIADCIDDDEDNDGVLDGADNCPFSSNHDQTDANQNGIGDACESSTPPITNPPSAFPITMDGQFGPPTAEWFGVTPATFLGGQSKVYTVVDPTTLAITLMYDVELSTDALAMGARIGPVSFQVGGGSYFDVFIIQGGPNTGFGPNPASSSGGTGDQVEVYLNGVPFNNSDGCVHGAVDHNSTSPNFAAAHNLVELEIKLNGFGGGCYSPEPAFWSATIPTVIPAALRGGAGGYANLTTSGIPGQTIVSAAFVDIDGDNNTIVSPLTEEVLGVRGQPTLHPAILQATPNPFADRTALLVTLAFAQKVDVTVVDISGRRVWRTPSSFMAAGQHRILWNGQDESGRQVKPGMYFVRVRGDAGLALQHTIIRLR